MHGFQKKYPKTIRTCRQIARVKYGTTDHLVPHIVFCQNGHRKKFFHAKAGHV